MNFPISRFLVLWHLNLINFVTFQILWIKIILCFWKNLWNLQVNIYKIHKNDHIFTKINMHDCNTVIKHGRHFFSWVKHKGAKCHFSGTKKLEFKFLLEWRRNLQETVKNSSINTKIDIHDNGTPIHSNWNYLFNRGHDKWFFCHFLGESNPLKRQPQQKIK